MKKIFLTLLAAATLHSAPAQLFSPESLGGALWGGLIGGVVGGDCHRGFSGDGAAIGAGIGFVAGTIAGEARRREYGYYSAPPVVVAQPVAVAGYGYGTAPSPYVYTTPNAYTAPGYYYRPSRPNYTVGGTLLGAASGALIGSTDHNAGKGAIIGAAAGLVVGSVAEVTAQQREKKMTYAQYAQTAAVPAPVTSAPLEPAPQDYNPDLNNPEPQPAPRATEPPQRREAPRRNQVTSKAGASSTYHWTARPQIANAPRVPDAPKF